MPKGILLSILINVLYFNKKDNWKKNKNLKLYCSKNGKKTEPKENRKGVSCMGRSSKNKIIENLELIETWAFEGLSKKEIAKRIGVTDRTLRNYESKDKRVFSALNSPIENMNTKVEYALLKCALGYEYEEEELTKVKEVITDSDGKKITRETYKPILIKKKVKPDVNAQKFWLNNRDEEDWKDNPHKVKNDKELMELRKKELEAKTF